MSTSPDLDCDWCGRPAVTVEFIDYAQDGVRFADPQLCRVCEVLLFVDGGEIGDLIEAEQPELRDILEVFAEGLAERYRDRVEKGQVSPAVLYPSNTTAWSWTVPGVPDNDR